MRRHGEKVIEHLGAASLQSLFVAQSFQRFHAQLFVQLGELQHDRCTEASAKVGWTTADVPQVIIVHVLVILALSEKAGIKFGHRRKNERAVMQG